MGNTPPLRLQRGFTIIELWVSVFIIGIIGAVTLAAFHRGTQFEKLRSARDELLDDLRTMHGYSVSGRPVVYEDAECSVNGCGGYGVHLQDNALSYTLYQDFNGNKLYESNNNELVATKPLSTGVRISQITKVTCTGSGCLDDPVGTLSDISDVDIHFAPFFGTTSLLRGGAGGQQVKVQLMDAAGNPIEFTVDKLAGGIRE